MNELLSFRKMITPVIIQIIFLVGVGLCALSGVATFLRFTLSADNKLFGLVVGLVAGALVFAVGALVVRIYCELIILLFKIYDELKAIRSGTAPAGQGFPVMPPDQGYPPQGYAQPGYPPTT
jgi:hypothetical protein